MIASDKNSLNNCTVTHITLKLHLKKNFMASFYGYGSTLSRLQSHYKETVYFLPPTDWLIHHTLHECSTTAQTILKCNW